MAEHLRALLTVLLFSLVYFYVARGAALQLLPEDTFKRWRKIWVASTLVLFLSHSIWLFMVLFAAILIAYRRREAHAMGLYFLLIFVSPPVPAEIPGLGIIDHIWVLNHYRVLGIALLLPAALSLLQRSSTMRLGRSPVDWMVLGYVTLMSLLAFRDGNVTSGLRTVLSLWIDMALPYYVASRSIRTEEGLRQAMTGYVIGAMLLAMFAIFEMLRTWKLYSAVLGALGTNEFRFGGYLTRSGLLRPSGTVGNSIVLGFALVVGLGFLLYLKEFLAKPLHRWMALGLLSAGIMASLSRGPWVGAIMLVVVFVVIGRNAFKRMVWLAVGGAALLLLLSQLPMGQLLIDMLPIFGDTEQENVEYRANLLTSAFPVISRNLLFGSDTFLDAPELQVMMQGEGIIDVVNSYVAVALHSGLIGLLFFAGAFLQSLLELRRGIRIARRHDRHLVVLGQALMATVVAIMLIIYTVSSITAIPVIYWPVLGLTVAYGGLMRAQGNAPKQVPTS